MIDPITLDVLLDKPADLPIEPPTKLGLSINLEAGKALGLAIHDRSCCARI